jgi:Protein of unknown function (DUF2442)
MRSTFLRGNEYKKIQHREGVDGFLRAICSASADAHHFHVLQQHYCPDGMNAPEQMFELVDVVRVEPRGGYWLALAFSDGTEGERDFAGMVAEGGEMVEPLSDPAFFTRVFLDEGILSWPNGFALFSIRSPCTRI